MNSSITRVIMMALAFLTAACILTPCAAGAERVAFELSLGVADQDSTAWDGELRCPEGLSIESAGILDLYPKDRGGVALPSARLAQWAGGSKCEVMRSHRYVGANIVRDPKGEPLRFPLMPYGMMIQSAGSVETPVTIATKEHGQFEFAPGDLKYGQPATFLDGRASVARAVATVALGTCTGENGAIRYNDFPAVCADPDGGAWIAYIAYTGSDSPRLSLKEEPKEFGHFRQAAYNDQLLVVREQGGVYSQPVAITAPGLDLLAPAIACDRSGRTAAFWSQGTAGNWDLYVSVRGKGAWSAPVRLTTEAGPDIYAAATSAGDDIWVAWQSFRGGISRILLGRLRADGAGLESVVEVTDGTANCWRPALAADGQGNLAVAYDTYAKGDYDVRCALVSPEGVVQREIAVAASLCYEAHASVAYDPLNRLWIAWEQAGEIWGKDFSNNKAIKRLPGEPVEGQRTLRLACWSDGRLLTTKTPVETLLPLQQNILTSFEKNPVHTRESLFRDSRRYAFYPKLACGSDGRIYLAYRQHDYLPDRSMANQTIWSDSVAVYEGDQWLRPVRVAGSDGQRHSAPAICAVPGGVVLACAGDGRASNGLGACDRLQNVRGGRLSVGPAGHAPVLVALPTAEPPAIPLSVAAERAAVRRMRDYRVTVAGQPLRILRGDTHRHTAFSADSAINDGCIEDAFRYALDAAALDFLSNGDHDNGGTEYAWYLTQKFYDVHDLPAAFVTMFGYERSRGESGIGGHRNVLVAERGIRVLPAWKQEQADAAGSVFDTQMLFRFLRHFGGVSIPHTIGTHAGPNFVDCAPDVDPVVEIYQGARDAYDYPDCPRGIKAGNDRGFFWSLLKVGRKYGVIASSDHTSTHMSYAMLYVSDMSRSGVLDALRRRHCYAATDNILLDVRVGSDHMMGDAFTSSVAPVLRIHAVGTSPIKQIDIIRNAEIVKTLPVGQSAVQTEWTDDMFPAGENSCYVRVLQDDGELAWGSPMWIRRP